MNHQMEASAVGSKFILLIILFMTFERVYAQSDYLIQGRVIDAKTSQPIPFATLSVANGQVSNQTNSTGYFMLNIPKTLKLDTLRLMALDYQLTEIPLPTLSAGDSIIRLNAAQAQSLPLDVYVSLDKPFQARDTLLKAVAVIAKNYANRPTLLHGFYRESIKEAQSDLCVSYAEGLIDVYKPSYYFTKKSDQLHFIKGRRKPLTAFTIPVLTPGPWASNMLDIVKYQEFLFRNGKLNKDYAFALTGRTLIGGQPVYIISFSPRSHDAASGYFAGKLFLVTGSLAIIRAEYELADRGLALLNKSQNSRVYSTTLQKRVYTANYTRFDNRWSFHSGSIENTFTSTSSDLPFQSRIDFVVTNRQSEHVEPFKTGEQADYSKMNMVLFDKTNDAFWDGESYIVPARSLPPLISGAGTP